MTEWDHWLGSLPGEAVGYVQQLSKVSLYSWVVQAELQSCPWLHFSSSGYVGLEAELNSWTGLVVWIPGLARKMSTTDAQALWPGFLATQDWRLCSRVGQGHRMGFTANQAPWMDGLPIQLCS